MLQIAKLWIRCSRLLATVMCCLFFCVADHRLAFAQDAAVEPKAEAEAGDDKVENSKPKLGAASTLIRGTVVDEQGDPVAGAIIESQAREEEQSFRVTANAKGGFVHRVKAVGHYGIPMLVRSPSGELSSFVSGYDYELTSAKPFKIVVRPERATTVQVVDEKDQPIKGASIQLVAQFVELAKTTSDASGQAVLTFPTDAKVDWIIASKSKQGFDYYENYDAFSNTGTAGDAGEHSTAISGCSLGSRHGVGFGEEADRRCKIDALDDQEERQAV